MTKPKKAPGKRKTPARQAKSSIAKPAPSKQAKKPQQKVVQEKEAPVAATTASGEGWESAFAALTSQIKAMTETNSQQLANISNKLNKVVQVFL